MDIFSLQRYNTRPLLQPQTQTATLKHTHRHTHIHPHIQTNDFTQKWTTLHSDSHSHTHSQKYKHTHSASYTPTPPRWVPSAAILDFMKSDYLTTTLIRHRRGSNIHFIRSLGSATWQDFTRTRKYRPRLSVITRTSIFPFSPTQYSPFNSRSRWPHLFIAIWCELKWLPHKVS